MTDQINLFRQMAKAESAEARKLWGHQPKPNSGTKRTQALPPKGMQMEQLFNEGKTRRQVAEEMSMTYQSVTSYINRYDIYPHKSGE